LELVQTITAVFDVARHNGSFNWSISGLFEREITQSCPLASTSKIIVSLPQTNNVENQYSLAPHPPQGIHAEGSGDKKQEVAVYDLKKVLTEQTPFQLSLHWQGSRPQSGMDTALFHFHTKL
jgi:phosphatidylinositol glycan class T